MKTSRKKNLISLSLASILLLVLNVSIASAQWVQKSNGIGNTNIINAMASIGSTLFAASALDGVWISTNNGDNWSQTILTQPINSFYVSGGSIYACGNGIFSSTNLGSSWIPLTLANGVGPITSMGGYLIAGTATTAPTGLYYSSNNGATWEQSSITNWTSYAFTSSGSNLFVGVQFSGVRVSTNQGVNWSATGLGAATVLSLLTSGSSTYAGTEFNGIYTSNNNGVNWTSTSFGSFGAFSIITQGGFL